MGATTAVLGAVNLSQTLKLKKAVEKLELRVENGFVNLEQALAAQGKELVLGGINKAAFQLHNGLPL